MRRILIVLIMLGTGLSAAIAQQRPTNPQQNPAGGANPAGGGFVQRDAAPRQEPKPYKDVITDKAVTHRGLFTVHRIEDKWYFEIPDSILGRDILVSTRYVRTPAGGNYGGEQVNDQTVRFVMGPSHTV